VTQHNDQTLALPVALGQAIIEYLANQPYKDVYHLIPAMQQLQPVQLPNELTGQGVGSMVGASAKMPTDLHPMPQEKMLQKVKAAATVSSRWSA